jgi:hypothetical protein
MPKGASLFGRQMAFWVPKEPWRPVLVDTRIAMTELGFSGRTIREMTEAGELRWVWNISVNQGPIRDLRYWVGELLRLKAGDLSARTMDRDAVIRMVVGHETQPELRSHTVCGLLLVTHPTLLFLHRAGELSGRVDKCVRWIERESLVEFLKRRLCS